MLSWGVVPSKSNSSGGDCPAPLLSVPSPTSSKLAIVSNRLSPVVTGERRSKMSVMVGMVVGAGDGP